MCGLVRSFIVRGQTFGVKASPYSIIYVHGRLVRLGGGGGEYYSVIDTWGPQYGVHVNEHLI